MKNKILFLGTLCLVLAFGLVFVGCDDGAQIVEFDTLGSPGNVNAVYSKTLATLTVTWDAVDGASNYNVVLSQEGKVTYVSLPYDIFGYANPAPVGTDLDKWRAVYSDITTSQITGTWKIGVVARSSRNDINDSDPAFVSVNF